MTSRADTLLDRVSRHAREQARAEARTTMAMLEFADARRAEYEATERTEWRDTELASVAYELAVELQMSVRGVQNRLHQARQVRGRTPAAWEAFVSGRIDGYRVRIISDALSSLHDPRSDGVVDDRVVGYAATHTATELRAWLRRLIARLEPQHHKERCRDAVNDRRVHIDHRDDGVSELWALLPTAQVAAIDTLLGDALLGKDSDDTRTSDQFMADELSRRLLAGADGEPAVKATIALTIPATSLAGLSDEPGTSIDGQWSLPASVVRELATQAGALFHRVITDPAGRVLDVTKLGRFAPADLEFGLEVRDAVCQFPTCTRPAARCDKDHRVPWPHGPTNGQNMWSLCRRHHRAKTAGIFTATLDDEGQAVWHLPSGRVVAAEQMALIQT
ncbi:MAG TPA: DUF222 domain-containing protein [Ilumatobacteraceae bacterium]|nr:DUF222 domain-containing protein [Ilumatobacteraceae bacterium]